jgi:hypothetical protein
MDFRKVTPDTINYTGVQSTARQNLQHCQISARDFQLY